MRSRRERGAHGHSIGAWLIGAALVAVVAAVPVLGDYHAFVLGLVMIQVIAVLSLNLLMGYAGQVSLGQAAFVGMGAFGAADLASWGVPFPVTVLVAAGLTAGAAAIVGLPSLRIRGLQLAVTTLAFGLAAELLLFARPWDETATLGVAVPRPMAVSGDQSMLLLCVGALVLVLWLDRGVRRTRVGRAFQVVRDREDIAAARGIPVGRTKLMAYAISGLYAGLAGALYAYLLERITATPFDVWHSLGYVAAAVVGGMGSWTGAVAAGAGFTALPELLSSVALFAPLVGAILLALIPALRPEGFGWLLDRRLRQPGTRAARHAAGDEEPLVFTPELEQSDTHLLSPPKRLLGFDIPLRTVLDVRGVEIKFGGLDVLRGVDLDVTKGEVVGLIGPNGAGKSTLFNAISGLVTPTAGTITYQGHDLAGFPPHARPHLGIARTFQHAGLCPNQTVLANVLQAQHHLGAYTPVEAMLSLPNVSRIERDLAARSRTALGLVGMADQADTIVWDLPHYRQRLVELAGALAAGPSLLLLDEPAAGIDPEEALEFSRSLRALRDRLGLTMIVIEHHVPLVADLCDRIVVLGNGVVIAQGDPATVQNDQQVQAMYLGDTEPVPADEPAQPATPAGKELVHA